MEMPEPATTPPRPPPATGALLTWLGVAYSLAAGWSLVLLVRGARDVGMIGLLLSITTAPIAVLLALGASRRDDSAALRREVRDALRGLEARAALSEPAREVLTRRAEREALGRAIEDDIAAGRWDAGAALVDDLTARFGPGGEAARLRERLEQARAASREEDLTSHLAGVDELVVQRRWDEALATCARLARLHPGSPRLAGLGERVRGERERYKRELMAHFERAARADQADEALAVLRELDFYLTPEEAEPFRETARGVIGRARDGLGAEFRAAVQERRWRDAERVGSAIIEQFPNTKMAAEVRDVIAGIREKAASG